MYRVIREFTDLQDNNFYYAVGAQFPRNGKEVSADRLAELVSAANKQGVPLIEEVREKAKAATTEPVKAEPVPVEDEPKKQRGKKRKE